MRKIIIQSDVNEKNGEMTLGQMIELVGYGGEDGMAHLFHEMTAALGALLVQRYEPDHAASTIATIIVPQLLSTVAKHQTGDVLVGDGDPEVPAEEQLQKGMIAMKVGGKAVH